MDEQQVKISRYVTQRVNLTAVIQIVLILAAMIAGWVKFDYRVTNLETTVEMEEQQTAKELELVDHLGRTLDSLDQRLQDFPLHRHERDGSIDYPYGTTDKAFDGEDLKKK